MVRTPRCRRLLALALFAGAASSFAQDFYEARLRAGEAALDSGRASDAAADLRVAAFGFLERPALLCEALATLTLAEQSAGRAADADAALARLVEVQRMLPACREARLDPRRRAELETLARRKLPASVVEELLAAPKVATPARPTAPPAATLRPTAVEAAPMPTSTPVPRPPPATATLPPAPRRAPTALPSQSPRAATSDDLDRQPQLKTTTPAVYPTSALRAGIGGVVLLSVLVSEKGNPLKVEVARGVHPDLDQAAVTAVRQWLFEPGRRSGAPVAAWMTVAVPFDSPRR
jgi:protein TonB